MSLLIVGVNHRSAPFEVLEKVAAIDPQEALRGVVESDVVAESMVVSTCNRVEVYAEISKFHPAVQAVTEVLSKSAGVTIDGLSPHMYVHYEESGVLHALRVASGLDSMVIGDEQILGQFREAFRMAQEEGAAGRGLHELAQTALRVGKRVHSTTGIGRHGASVVEVALGQADRELGGLAGRRAVIVGTGAMSSLAAAVLSAAGAEITVVGRTPAAVQRLAESVGGRSADISELDSAVAQAEIVVSATAAAELLLTAEHLDGLRAGRTEPLVVCDLAVPHDTDPGIGELPGVTRLDIAHVGALPGATVAREAAERAEAIVVAETSEFVTRQTVASVEPIVVALRGRAEDVLSEELRRLRLRLGDLSEQQFDEVVRAMRRMVNTLLHTPTVRMKEFAADPGGDRYAQALHALFDLDPAAVETLSAAQPPSAPETPGA